MKKDEQLGVSRRSFLKGAGLAAAAMAGTAALAGCANESAGGADTLANTGDWLPQTWDYECDLLVIGYGGAGMWASLIGADECGQQVLVLEKAPERGGGNSSINNGEWTIVEEADKERFKDYIRAFTKGKTPDPMIEAWVEECVRNTEYADKYGMTYEVVEQALAGAIPEYFFLDDNAYEGSCKLSSVDGFGMLSFHELDAQREALGVEVLFDCHDERLIQNPQTKEIVGAYTMIGNEEKTVKARKAVIMTLGGFEFNEEHEEPVPASCSPLHRFEGWPLQHRRRHSRWSSDVGATAVAHGHGHLPCELHVDRANPEYDFSHPVLHASASATSSRSNRLGKRFVNENNMGSPHNGWHTLLSFDDSIADFDRIPSWGIFDQSCFDAGKLSTSQGDFFECGNFASDLPDSVRDWDGWSQDNKAELERGWILTGATIEELGQKIKEFDPLMDVDTLKATFEEYQGFAAAGKDARFDRAADTMVPLDNGPYYAVSIYPGSCSTLGGPMKNENAQVLDPAQNPIPRLYAAGCFGNFQSHTYGITGGNNAENQVWGRIAARHASGLENWDAE